MVPFTVAVRAQAAQADVVELAGLPDAPQPRRLPQARAGNEHSGDLSLKQTPQRLLTDEWQIVKSPVHIGKRDLRWLLPLAGATAVAIGTDSRAMRDAVSTNPGFNNANNTTSGVLRDAFIAAPVILFGAGEMARQERSRDTGLLAGEAIVNAYVTSEAIKYVTFRERPQIVSGRGHFFAGDAASDPSFVSGHSIVAWSSAAVLASEYTKPWEQIGIYSAAGAVSITRVLAQQHFPSDVLLGSVAGWLIGHYVFEAHSRKPRVHPSTALGRQRDSHERQQIASGQQTLE